MKAEETDIFERYNALLSEIPDHVILSEGPAETDMTVKDLNLISAKVYRYLNPVMSEQFLFTVARDSN